VRPTVSAVGGVRYHESSIESGPMEPLTLSWTSASRRRSTSWKTECACHKMSVLFITIEREATAFIVRPVGFPSFKSLRTYRFNEDAS